jgi:phage shock protein A
MGVSLMGISDWVAISGLALNIMVAVVGVTWGIAKIRDTVRTEIDNHRDRFNADIDDLRKAMGETVAGLRQRIAEVELYAANQYVRREGFYEVQKQLAGDIKAMGEQIAARLERMENKIDSKPSRTRGG